MATLLTPGVSVGFFLNGKWLEAKASHPQYTAIETAVGAGELEKAEKLISLKTAVSEAIKGSQLKLVGNSLEYKGTEVRGVLGKRILSMLKLGYDCSALEAFLSNLMENPSDRAVQELYGFLEVSGLPITDDGYFLAYKSIRDNFTDHHTGTMDNSVGAVVEMPRNTVDEDKDRTCSRGLHFAAHEYASSFYGSGRMVVLKINPRDVVAIPSDYNNQKGRACKYTILREVSRDNKELVDTDIASGHNAPTVLWNEDIGILVYQGDLESFPTEGDVPYMLERKSNGKIYGGYFYYSHHNVNGHIVLVRMGPEGTKERYVTISDISDWFVQHDLDAE
tara:strand:+ start:1280 stop:2284 length:1005 start_codon:yes stop_codon:yes gene_type:complete